MTQFKEIKPGKIINDSATAIPELLQYFLSRIQFVPNTRFSIGWRGIKPAERFENGWTFKVGGFKGVFGLCFDHSTETNNWLNGSFAISYFPHPDEDLIERFSLAAAYQTQQADYFEKIREFMAHPEMRSLFNIGDFILSINHDETDLMLTLKALSRHKVIATDGIEFPETNESNYLIAPGGIDQNLPTFVIAYALFKVLASTVTFSLQQAPNFLCRNKRRGNHYAYSYNGDSQTIPSETINDIELYLGYGKANFKQQIEIQSVNLPPTVQTENWTLGEPHPEFCKNALWWIAHQIDDLRAYDKRLIGIEDRPQLLVISGFLGSGKTSMLQHFLEHQVQRDRFVAVLQNEFGETGLDGKLLDDTYSVTELNEGTVCCTLSGELRPAINNIINRFQPDMIVLETSGATNPIGLRDDFMPLSEMVRFDSITTVVDASNYNAVDNYEVAADQITAADLIVLNKTDMVDAQTLEQITKDIRIRNPFASIHPTTQGYINPGLIYDLDVTRAEAEESTQQATENKTSALSTGHHHSHNGISSIKIDLAQPVDMDDFINVVESMPPSVFRLKGIVSLGAGQAVLVQYVCGHYDISNFQNPNITDRFIVIIGHELDQTAQKFQAMS
ncbi:CobW family GTP-binding protein [Thalassotalea piscium]